jgi:predicted aspartyl protease
VLIAGAVVLAAACAPAAVPPKASLTAASIVPLQSLDNLILVSATVNRSDQAAVFMVDTGASRTIIGPLLARRLGLTVPKDAVRHDLRIVGGTVVTVPFIRVGSLQVGEAMIEQMDVGVYDFAPDVRIIDGMLGGDFLNRFRVTFDQAARRMTLEPLPAAR